MEDVESVAGDLQVGCYAALEGDLGERLCAPLGFGSVWDDGDVGPEGFVASAGFQTAPGRLVFVEAERVWSWVR